MPATIIYFTAYDQLRDYLHTRMGSWSHSIPLLAGALARRECRSPEGSPVPTLSWLCWHHAGGSGTALEQSELIAHVPVLQWAP